MAAYAQRYNRIENDIRDLKVTLNLNRSVLKVMRWLERNPLWDGCLQYGCPAPRLAAAKASVEPKG